MMKKQNRITVLITVTLLCVLVIFSTIMVGCNKRDEGRVEAPDVTDDVPEPEDPDEKDKEDEKDKDKEDPEDKDKEEEKEEPEKKPDEPEKTEPTTPVAPVNPTTPTAPTNPITPTTPQKPVTPTKPVTYDDVVFNKAGTYSQSMVYQDGTVKKGGAVIKNKTFKGDVVIDAAVGKGEVDFNNVIIEGTLYVYGGGSNSVALNSCTVKKMVVDRDDNTVRVVASGKTEVGSILIKDDAILQEKSMTKGFDGFKNVFVDGHRGLELSLRGLKLNKLTTESRCTVDLDSKTIVNVFYADAVTAVTGQGDIEKLVASVSGVTYETKPDKISTTDGAKRPTEAEDDDDDWDDNWDSRPTVSLTVPNSSCTVLKDAVYNINVNTDGTSVSASSSNTNVAAVAVNGNLLKITGKQEGTATITVTASRSGYYSRSVSIAVKVTAKAEEFPKIAIKSTVPQTWTKDDITVTFTVTGNDTISKVTVNGQQYFASANSEYTFTAKENGDYVIEAVNSKNNSSNYTVKIDKIDRAAPKIEDVQIFGEGDSKKNISVKVTDTVGEIAKVECVPTDTSTPVTKTTPNTEGRYVFEAEMGKTYTITAVDEAGNASQATTVKIESSEANQLSIGQPNVENPDLPAQSKQVSFTVAVPAGQSNVEIAVQSPTNKAVTAAPRTARNRGYTVTYTFTAEENGAYQITAKSGGQTATATANVTGIDHTDPVISNVQVADKVITFTVTDENGGSGVKEVKVGDVTVDPASGQSYSYDTQAAATTTYTITAVDNAGNKATATATVTVETAEPPAPVITVTSSDNYTIRFTATNATSVKVNGRVENSADGNYVYQAEQGAEKAYTITAENAAGKTATKEVQIKDTTKPVIGEPQYSKEPTNQNVTVAVEVTDASGIQSVTVDKGNQVSNNGNNYSFTVIKNGTYIITATDKKGNTDTKTVTIENIDTISPTVENVVNPAAFQQSKVISFEVWDNVAVKSVVCTPNTTVVPNQARAGGYSFTVTANGAYTITVTDTAGNTTTHKIEVIKIDTTKPAAPVLKNGAETVKAVPAAETAEKQSFAADKNIFAAAVTQKTENNAANTVKAQYSLNNQTDWKDVPANGLTLQAGEHTVYLKAVDLAGNASAVQKYHIVIAAAPEEPAK